MWVCGAVGLGKNKNPNLRSLGIIVMFNDDNDNNKALKSNLFLEPLLAYPFCGMVIQRRRAAACTNAVAVVCDGPWRAIMIYH